MVGGSISPLFGYAPLPAPADIGNSTTPETNKLPPISTGRVLMADSQATEETWSTRSSILQNLVPAPPFTNFTGPFALFEPKREFANHLTLMFGQVGADVMLSSESADGSEHSELHFRDLAINSTESKWIPRAVKDNYYLHWEDGSHQTAGAADVASIDSSDLQVVRKRYKF